MAPFADLAWKLYPRSSEVEKRAIAGTVGLVIAAVPHILERHWSEEPERLELDSAGHRRSLSIVVSILLGQSSNASPLISALSCPAV